MTPGLPQELIDHIVDLSHNDKRSLLLLLETARVFGERCRGYLYRHVSLETTAEGSLTARCLALRDLLTIHKMGRLVLSLRCHHVQLDAAAAVSQLVSDFTLYMPRLRELRLGTSFDDSSFDFSPMLPTPNSITTVSIGHSKHSAEGLLTLMRRCPNLTSLQFAHVTVPLVDTTPQSAVSSDGNRCAVVNSIVDRLVLHECKARFLRLICDDSLTDTWRNLRRLFIIGNGFYWGCSQVITIAIAITVLFGRHASLTFLYLTVFSPPESRLHKRVAMDILRIPHVVLHCSNALLSKDWLELLLTCLREGRVPLPSLVKLDVILHFPQWPFFDKDFLGRFTDSLHHCGIKESFRLRFIITNISTENKRKRVTREFGRCTRTAQLIVQNTLWDEMHHKFMDGDISG